MFNNLRELILSMPEEQTCRDYLANLRWKGVPTCPYCGHQKTYRIENDKRYKCANRYCYKKFSVTVGTVMEDSNIPLVKWFTAMYISTAHKKGISSYQLGKDIGVSQRCAWFMLHRLREMMSQPLKRKFDNIVEADHTFLGGSISNKHYRVRKEFNAGDKDWKVNKSTTLGIIERNGEMLLQFIPANQPGKTVSLIRENLEFAANLVTDEANEFKLLNDDYYHNTVNHSKQEFKRLHFHTNSIEGVFSHLKRMVYGIYHQISPKHTQRYLNEFMYRFNSRKLKDAERFQISLSKVEGRLKYRDLINTPDPAKRTRKVSNYVKARSKPVIQRLNDELIGQFPSIGEAFRQTGIGVSVISKAARKATKSGGGYEWDFS